ncbi:tautomerase family protein [Pseudomonas sp. RIT-To-2]|uniref:tautomerase family protein n=1 Tax=Pseudomonas sp. RIT-To-2 TaxID=3462541 RepID=UPI0024135F72
MPFVRISLLQGRSAEYLQALSDGIHQAMVDTFDVPPSDRFQIIHQHGAGELLFDRDYLAGPRSEAFTLIAITAGKPRSNARRQAFYQTLVRRLHAKVGLDPEDVMVVITTTAAEEWSFGGGRMNGGTVA